MTAVIGRVHGLARVSVALVWIYHGLVPKLLGPHRDELYLAAAHGLPAEPLPRLLQAAGAIEIGFGILLLITWRWRWPFLVSAALLVLLLVDIALVAPQYLVAAFNPVSLNLALISLSLIGWLTADRRVAGPA